jgi:16S rRNA (cytidine1402-2'-O)-methyltransferase
LEQGFDVGIVTDRGTPIISDPGYELVKAAIESGYNVIALPGPTAFVPALISSGLSPMPFTFVGFLNSKLSKKQKELEQFKENPTTMIFYESPKRIVETLQVMKNVLGNRKISISREISKKYEEIYRGTIDEVIPELDDVKGEIVLVVDGCKKTQNTYEMDLCEHVKFFINQGYLKKDAIKEVAHLRGLSKNEVYQEFLRGEK